MNRRVALKTFALGAGVAALDLSRLGAAGALAQTTPSAGPAPAAQPAAGPFTLPPLPYAADALEPHLDAPTMTLHHDRHHAGYVANLNKAVAGRPELETRPVEQLLRGLVRVPESIRTAVRNHGGGHYNHTLLWTSMKRDGARVPSGPLATAMNSAFGSFETFHEKFRAAALSVFGSGWAWLSLDPKAGLRIETSANQDSPLLEGRTPLLGVDVWEHAYYLKFQNRRADYLAEFAKVVDWDAISARYQDARG